MKKIIIKNTKGGVGKSTATINIAVGLGLKGFKVLVIDLDGQCDSTYMLSKNIVLSNTIDNLLLNTSSVENCIVSTIYNGVDLLPASEDLPETIEKLSKDVFNNPVNRLNEKLSVIDTCYDYVVIDCDPTINLIAINALIAADICLVPTVTADTSSSKVDDMYDYCNQSNTKMLVFISDKERNKSADESIITMKDKYKDKLLNSVIRHQAKPCELSISKDVRRPLILDNYPISTDYLILVDELVEVINEII